MPSNSCAHRSHENDEKDGHQLTFHWWQAQLPRNLRITDFPRVLQGHAPHELGQITAARDGATASKGLELDIADGVVIRINADLEFHDVATCGSSNKPSADVGVGF